MKSLVIEQDLGALKQRVIDFVRDASMEITPHEEHCLPELKEYLAPGAVVYVAHPPKAALPEVLRIARQVQAMGWNACAHIVARRLNSRSQARAALQELHDAGCKRCLLVAGDQSSQSGPFASTLEVLASGAIDDSPIKTIAFAAHPEGSRAIGPSRLWHALAVKQAFAESSGLQVYLVTQFGFNAQAIIDFSRQLHEHGIRLPVHVGLAGPASLAKLIRYAMLCGIGASMRAVAQRTSALPTPSKMAAVDEILVALVCNRTDADRASFVKPHFYSFGGSVATARWMQAVREGRFEMRPDGEGFVLSS
jgi:methylenetetrahydrofolate reductase (NADPH)